MAKKRNGCFGIGGVIALLLLGTAIVAAYYAYNYVVKENIQSDKTQIELLIPTNATFETVLDSLRENNILKNEASFLQVAKAKSYHKLVKPGRYLLDGHWNNIEIVNHLRSGKQAPVNLTINNARLREDIAGKVSNRLEVDSITLLNHLNNPDIANKYGFSIEEFPAMFLANTYEFYWNTDSNGFLDRMKTEYDKYWTSERIQQAKKQGLTPVEAITLASIVEEETKESSELPMVAGLYLNRLRRGMKLQADPTVKYAVGDFSIRRVLNIHLETDSPYNTYMYEGLPPGPIRVPELNAVNAVLNPANHDYIYMAANSDFSGTHAFATNLSDHNRNANRYRQALNERGIYR